jgi:protein TonB
MLIAHAALVGWLYKTRIEAAPVSVGEERLTTVTMQKLQAPKPPPQAKIEKIETRQRPLTPRHVDQLQPAEGPSQLVEAPKADPAPETPKVVEESPKPPATHLITRPVWEKLPDGEVFASYYPDRAQRLGKGGKVRLDCKVAANGALQACDVADETPKDYGFGEASLKISRFFRMKPGLDDGRPIAGASVFIDIVWRAPD